VNVNFDEMYEQMKKLRRYLTPMARQNEVTFEHRKAAPEQGNGVVSIMPVTGVELRGNNDKGADRDEVYVVSEEPE
jgi:hypothetical protein